MKGLCQLRVKPTLSYLLLISQQLSKHQQLHLGVTELHLKCKAFKETSNAHEFLSHRLEMCENLGLACFLSIFSISLKLGVFFPSGYWKITFDFLFIGRMLTAHSAQGKYEYQLYVRSFSRDFQFLRVVQCRDASRQMQSAKQICCQ